MDINSGLFVGVGAHDDPKKNKRFAQNYVNEIVTSYKNSNEIVIFERDVEGAVPYHRKFKFCTPTDQ